MAYLNRAFLIGNVGKDPEVRNVQGGAKVAQFTLATSERYTDRNGESHENTEWHTIVVWNKSAEFVEKFVKKGSQLFVEGKIRTRSFDTDAGVKYVTEVVADRVQMLGKKDGEAARQSSYQPSYQVDDDDFPM